jgi:hypothetical protein
MLCIYNLHHNYAGRAGPPRAWPSAADRAAAGLAGSRWPGLWPARLGPPAASCGLRMHRGLRGQPRRVLTGTPSARQACRGRRGGGVTPTVIRSRTFHCIHWPQGARQNTRGRTAAAVRASRNDSRGEVHAAREAIHCAQAMLMCSALDFSRASCSK